MISLIQKHFPPALAETRDSPCFGQPSSAAMSCPCWRGLDVRADVQGRLLSPKLSHAGLVLKTVNGIIDMLHPGSNLRLYLKADVVLAPHVDVKLAHEIVLHVNTLCSELIVCVPGQQQLQSCNVGRQHWGSVPQRPALLLANVHQRVAWQQVPNTTRTQAVNPVVPKLRTCPFLQHTDQSGDFCMQLSRISMTGDPAHSEV
eukprot:1456781-Rhodomonas_salina.4